MQIIQIPTNDPILLKIKEAMNNISTFKEKGDIKDLTYSELRFLKRLILADEATTQIMYLSLEEHIKFTKECDSNANNS